MIKYLIIIFLFISCNGGREGIQYKGNKFFSLKSKIETVYIYRCEQQYSDDICDCWSDKENFQVFIDENLYIDHIEAKMRDSIYELNLENMSILLDSTSNSLADIRPRKIKYFDMGEGNGRNFYLMNEEFIASMDGRHKNKRSFNELLLPNRQFKMQIVTSDRVVSHSSNGFFDVVYFSTNEKGVITMVNHEHTEFYRDQKISL